MKFSPSQQEVINVRNKNILVSAAAGSGKTTVLVERIIKLLINEKEDIDKFLIVTFTNAAASGMKQKIHKALIKALYSSKDKEHLSRQLNLLNKANISTIHSFCIDVVRKNFHVTGIDPGFRIGDVNEVDILLQESIDEVLEDYYAEKPDGFVQLVESFTGNRGDLELNDIIKDIYKFILSFPDPLNWLLDSVNMLSMSENDFESSLWVKAVKDNLRLQLCGALEALNTAREICLEDDGPLAYEEAISQDVDNVGRLEELLSGDFNDFTAHVHSVSFPALKALKGKQKEDVSKEKQEDVKSLRDDYKKIINNIKKMIPKRSLSEFVHDINHMYLPMKSLYDITVRLDAVFKSKKMDKSIADFNDVEHYALQILREKDIKERYRNKFKYIFIDEYQDSNSLQEELISQIKRENNLFMVGDVKQSIYRFRLSDPTIFNEKSNSYPVVDCQGFDRRIDLNQNFRSRKEILSSINYIFKNIMNRTIGEIEYDESAFLNPGAEFTEDVATINNCFTELIIIDKNSSESEDSDDEIKSMKLAELEATFAVQKINELLKENKNQPVTRDKDTNEVTEALSEKLQYKDIVILMRSVSSWAGIFEEIFNEQGIPFYFDGGTGYFETIEIQVVLNLLSIIDNIRQDIPLLSVMRSAIGSFTTEELVQIRVRNPKYNFIDALYEYKNNCRDELAEKLTDFISKIENWKKRSRYTSLNDFIWEILMETNYYYFVGLLPNGKIRQANLRLLSDKAFDFEKTFMSGLFNFLRYVEKLKFASGDSSSAKTLGENDNVVRLMTVHKSKGLEFPVVIMCGLNKKFNKTDSSKSILKHKFYGIAPKYINTDERIYRETLSRSAIKNIIKIENLSEEMRVLYVAMTRAIDRLIMIGTVDRLENKIKKWQRGPSVYNIYSGNSFLDWISTVLFRDIDSDNILRIVNGCSLSCEINYSLSNNSYSTKWNINKISLAQIYRKEQEEADYKARRINEISCFKNQESGMKEEINRRLNYKYAYNNSVNIPTKLSVTDLKVLRQERLEHIKFKIPTLKDIPQFKEKALMFTRTEIGTIVHFVMQHLNIGESLTKDNILQQVNKMVAKKLLTENEAEVVNIDMLHDFFNTDIGIRMRASCNVKREVPFVIKKNANEIISSLNTDDVILIQGIIDCYFYEGDQVVIIDYKTDKIVDGIIEQIKDEYSPQILSYKEAVEKITGDKVKACYLYLFDIGQAVEIK